MSPVAGAPDVDDVTYWADFSPKDSDEAARHVDSYARVGAMTPEMLVWEWKETSQAATRSAGACTHEYVTTQGHIMTAASFTATLIVEAAIHYLDIAVCIEDAAPADSEAVRLVDASRRASRRRVGHRRPWLVASSDRPQGEWPGAAHDLRPDGPRASRGPVPRVRLRPFGPRTATPVDLIVHRGQVRNEQSLTDR